MTASPRHLAPLFCLLTLTACTPSALDGTFDSPDPAAKLNAIRSAGISRDRSAVPHLIQQLDSDDPSVRLFAIGALERITGTRLGYIPYDPPPRRRIAIDRWLQAYHENNYEDLPIDQASSTAIDTPSPADAATPPDQPITNAAQ